MGIRKIQAVIIRKNERQGDGTGKRTIGGMIEKCVRYWKIKSMGMRFRWSFRAFLGDEELYKSCLPMVAEDEAFDGLKEALAEDERKKAFDCAHTLKGVFANMGITPMFDTVEKL